MKNKKSHKEKINVPETIAFGMLGLCLVFAVVAVGYAGFSLIKLSFFDDDPEYNVPLSEMAGAVVYEVEYVEPVYIEVMYNTTEVVAETKTLIESYFNVTCDNAVFNLPTDMYWQDSYYSDETHDVVIGLSGIENDSNMFRMVLTHELAHYALHQLELQDGDWHEALADAFTWRTNERASKIAWGENNEGRSWPYNVISTTLISTEDDDCLKKVFSKDNKIDSIKEIIDNLEEDCDYDIVSLINQL
jgi:hypothetical protein